MRSLPLSRRRLVRNLHRNRQLTLSLPPSRQQFVRSLHLNRQRRKPQEKVDLVSSHLNTTYRVNLLEV
jgi:hypothetical protein